MDAAAAAAASPSYSPLPSDDDDDQAHDAPVGMPNRALLACCPRAADDALPCPLTKTGLTALQRRDPGAYDALRALSKGTLPEAQALSAWCEHGGGCEAPCKGTRRFNAAEMLRHAYAKGCTASQQSEGEDDDEPTLGASLHALFFHVLAAQHPSRCAPSFEEQPLAGKSGS